VIFVHSELKPKGHVKVQVINQDGSVANDYEFDNMIVTTGNNLLRDFLKGDSLSGIKYLALGTGATAPAATDTQLETEVYRVIPTDTSLEDNILHLYFFISSAATNGTYTELGLFANDATSTFNTGTLFSRTVPAQAISKTSTQALTIQWDITV
jgi:hypothetical protein